MNINLIITRPHRLLLIRFFTQGLIAAVLVTLAAVIILTDLERDNYLRYAAETASERVARVAERLSHSSDNMPTMKEVLPAEAAAEMQTSAEIVQQLVAQETQSENMLRLEVVNQANVIIAAQDQTVIGQTSAIPDVADVSASGQPVSRVISTESSSFFRFAAPITINGEIYTVLIDEPLTKMESALAASRTAVTLTLSVGFLLSFLVQGLIVYRAGLNIERHQQEEAHVKNLLGRYVSHQVATQILAHGGLDVGGERRQITVLFTDIRGFTSIAETLPPERVVTLLNDYLAAMTEIVFKYDGTVDKFLGDGLMAIFGAPLGHHDDAQRAANCAKEMQKEFFRLREKWRAEGLPELAQGIGVNTGEAVVGSVGSSQRLDYTAIGDVVNTAQRLQSIAGGDEILVSAATCKQLSDEPAESLGSKQVKGRLEPVNVFRLAY